jgi:hypothetical protein
MIFDKDGNISIITQEKVSIVELVKKLDVIYARFKNDNIIINLTSLKPLSTEDVVEFLKISNQHRKSKHSFVIVTNKIKLEDIPDELVMVPTMQEAYDIIEMEEIERDLGF